MDLRNSVARVLRDSHADALAGTAFMFAVLEDRQLWMTCHHVIRSLQSFRLAVYSSESPYVFSCEYQLACSAPQVDIAVLETRLTDEELASLKLRELPLGSPTFGASLLPDKVSGCGYSTNLDTYPRGINFDGSFSARQFLRNRRDDAEKKAMIRAIGNPWNIPFEDEWGMDLYEFYNAGLRLERGFSGSPVCVEIEPNSNSKMCIGMLSSRRLTPTSEPTHGFVIPYEQIRGSCPGTLPFHAYADCVIVVLAAKRSEFERVRDALDLEGLKDRSDHYHAYLRDEWRPFMLSDPAVKDMLSDESQSPSWQLSSEYIDRIDCQFADYLADRSEGALVYVIDPSSIGTDNVCEIMQFASDLNRGACYIVPLCDVMSASRKIIEAKLKEKLGVRLWNNRHGARVQLVSDPTDFTRRVRDLVCQAWDQFIWENSQEPRRRIPEASEGRTVFSRMQWRG